jgi:protein-S-isoprenylcysteine O-methyltransferase Ste14
MLSSVFFLLAAEALLTTSWAVAAWGVVFVLGNLVYMPFVEEPGLRKRFGEDYEEYCRHVPRWIPRWTPWDPGASG